MDGTHDYDMAGKNDSLTAGRHSFFQYVMMDCLWNKFGFDRLLMDSFHPGLSFKLACRKGGQQPIFHASQRTFLKASRRDGRTSVCK